MAYDKNRPATSEPVKTGWPVLITNQQAIEAAIVQDHDFTTGGSQTGKHNRATLLDVAGDEAGVAGALTIWNDAGTFKYRNTTGTVRKISADGDVIPAATKMWFYADSAPTGWTIDGTPSDELLGIKGGATYTTGGVQAGTWTQPNHAHTTPDHSLTAAENGAHTHTFQVARDNTGSGPNRASASNNAYESSDTTESSGSGDAHNHGNTGNSATANTWRPLARVGIICSKDAY